MWGSASTRAKRRYNLKAYDRIQLYLPAGMAGELKAYLHADQRRPQSLNGFFVGKLLAEIATHQVQWDIAQAQNPAPPKK